MNNTFREYPDVVSIEELQDMLHIGRNAAYDIVKEGKIKPSESANDISFRKQAL